MISTSGGDKTVIPIRTGRTVRIVRTAISAITTIITVIATITLIIGMTAVAVIHKGVYPPTRAQALLSPSN